MMGDERPLPDIQRPFLIRDEDGKLHLKKNHDIKLLFNIGVNPFVATRFNYMSAGIPAAREENRCTYIVIDPVYTNSAAHADIWLSIIPGADAALLSAMLHYIITNDSSSNSDKKYLDHEFINNYTTGWKEFKDSFLAHVKKTDPSNNFHFFTPEWAEEKTGISEDNIKKISHLFGITKPAAMEIGMHGTAHHTNGDVTSVLMTTLCLITGNVDVPGGLVFIDSQKAKKGNRSTGKHFLENVVSRKANGSNVSGKLSELNKDLYGDYPAAWKGVLADLPKKIRRKIKLRHGPFKGHTYPVKAFITRAGNPVITADSTPDWIDALTSQDKKGEYLLDLMVFIDTHITVTGKYADIILPEAGFLERMGVSDVYTMSPEIALRDQVIKPLYESKTPYEFMIALSAALIENGDPDIRAGDFSKKYSTEEDFINEVLSEAPGFFNIGRPLPYPDLPEGCLIIGTPDNPAAVWGKKIIKKGELLTVDWLRKHHGVAVWPSSYYRFKKSNNDPSGLYPKTASKKFEFRFSYLESINKKFETNFPVTFYWSDCKWNPKSPLFKDMTAEYPFQLITGRVHYAMTMTAICPYLAETETECMKPMNNDFQYISPELKHLPNKQGIPDKQETHFNAGTVSVPVFAIHITDGKNLGIQTGDLITLENPSGKKIKGKVFLTEDIMPGVIKTAFGAGGQNASGLGFINNVHEYTPNINQLFDPDNLSAHTGMPGFGDMMVKVIKSSK
jgi:anaerobic selenocysteine-containing dehydrogenase